MKCRKGLHELDPNYRAPNGSRCQECYTATQARYDGGAKGRARHRRYSASGKGHVRQHRHNHSQKGLIANRRYDHTNKGQVRKRRYDRKRGTTWDAN